MKTCPYKYMGCTLIGIDSIFSAVLVITCMVIQQRSEDEEHVQTHTVHTRNTSNQILTNWQIILNLKF